MDESVALSGEKLNFDGTQNTNDVVPCITMATEETTHNDYYKTLICTTGAGSVSSLSLSDDVAIRTTLTLPTAAVAAAAAATAAVTAATAAAAAAAATAAATATAVSNTDSTEEEKMIPNVFVNANAMAHNLNAINTQNKNNNNNGNGNNGTNNNASHNLMTKTKRRRRKSSKQKSNTKPYKKSNWNFQNRATACNGSSRLVPYNTNQFLMEEHMPEINTDCGGRYRDSSFSFDSDNNDKEEYLSKEFCSLYENTRSDRLYEMSKTQLIQEYLQLEASYDKLSNKVANQSNLGNRSGANVLKRLADRVSELTAENLGKY